MAKRKMSENSLKNLKPVQSKKEARERGKNGGIKSGESRRENKPIKDVAYNELNEKIGKITFQEASIKQLKERILKGEVKDDIIIKFLEFMRDTSGQKPANKVEQDLSVSASLTTIDFGGEE